MTYSSVLSALSIQLKSAEILISAGFDMSTAPDQKKQSGKTLLVAKALGQFIDKLKGRLKNHPESQDALDLVSEHIKTVSPGQIESLDWQKASALFQKMGATKAYEQSQQPQPAPQALPKPKPGLPGPGGRKPVIQAPVEPNPDMAIAVATAAVLGLRTCSKFIQSSDSLDVLLPTGDKTQGMGRDPQKNVEDALPSKVPNEIVAARCKAISTDGSPIGLAAEAALAIGIVGSVSDAQEDEVDPESIEMMMHMAELILADLADGLEAVDIPSPQETSLILGIPLQPDAQSGPLAEKIQALSYTVDEILEGITQLDASSPESFEEGLKGLAEKITEVDDHLKGINSEENPDDESEENPDDESEENPEETEETPEENSQEPPEEEPKFKSKSKPKVPAIA